eukprot:jgi/Bigna1/147185/aug1.131_g21893
MSDIFGAVQRNDLASLKRLMEGEEANIEAKNRRGHTPLIIGALRGHLKIVQYLVGKKANIEAKNKHGETPLIKGGEWGHLEIVQYLVGKKANIEVKNNQGKTAAEVAIYNHHDDVVGFLHKDAEIQKRLKEAQETEDGRKEADKEMKKDGQDAEKAERNQKKDEKKSSPR